MTGLLREPSPLIPDPWLLQAFGNIQQESRQITAAKGLAAKVLTRSPLARKLSAERRSSEAKKADAIMKWQKTEV